MVPWSSSWRPENIICNMASGSLIGQSFIDLVSATWWTVKVNERSWFRASVLTAMTLIPVKNHLLPQRWTKLNTIRIRNEREEPVLRYTSIRALLRPGPFVWKRFVKPVSIQNKNLQEEALFHTISLSYTYRHWPVIFVKKKVGKPLTFKNNNFQKQSLVFHDFSFL